MFHAPVLNSTTGQWEGISPLDGVVVRSPDRNSVIGLLNIFEDQFQQKEQIARLTLDCQQYMDKLEICVRGLEDIRKHSEDAFSSVTAEETLEKVFGKVPRV